MSEEIKVPKGVSDGINLRVVDKGHFRAGIGNYDNEVGDLMIELKVEDHPRLKREGENIHSSVNISVTQAILGSTIKIETLNGKHDL